MFDPRDYITIITKRYSICSGLHGLSWYLGQTDTRCEFIKKSVNRSTFSCLNVQFLFCNGNPRPLLTRMIS